MTSVPDLRQRVPSPRVNAVPSLAEIRSRVGSTRIPLSLAVLVGLLPLLVVAGASLALDIDVQLMTRDVAAIGEVHPLAGVLSSLGVLLWWTSASIWLFSAAVWHLLGSRQNVRFALATGVLSAYLAFDDLFQFHEALAPTYLGVPEIAVYGALAAAVGTYLVTFWPRILERGLVFVLLAFALLGASAGIDVLLGQWLWRLGHWIFLLEDGLKWLGLCSWFAFAVSWCRGGLSTHQRGVVHNPA